MATGSNVLYSNQQLAVTDLHYVAPPTVAMADDHYLRGVNAVKEQDYLGALHFFSKASFLAPNEPLPYVARAEAFTHLCDLRSAITSYRKAVVLMKDPVAVQDLKARLAQVLDAQGVALFREGQSVAALRYAEESLAEHYHSIAELHKALYLIATHDAAAAETILASSLLQKPEVKADATALLVELQINLRKDFAQAKFLLEAVLAEHGRHPRVLNAERFFDSAFFEFKREAEATLDIDKLTKCVLAFPGDAALYQIRAAAYAKKKNYTLAVQDLFSSITKSGGTNPEASLMMKKILFSIATELVEVKDYVSALNYFTESLKWAENDATVLIARGDCHVLMNQHEEALQDFKAVLVADSTNVVAKQRLARLHDSWGTILYRQAKYEIAEAEFSKAIMHYDQDPMMFYRRAQCRLMLKQPEFVVRDLMSCRDLGPSDPDIAKLVLQICPLSKTANGGGASDASGVALPGSLTRLPSPDRPRRRAEDPAISAAQVLEAPPIGCSLADLSRASATLSVQKSSLEDRFNPLAIREYVKNCTSVAASSSVVVVVNPVQVQKGKRQQVTRVGGASSSECDDGAHAGATANSASSGCFWGSSKREVLSRLDRVPVSSEAPIPKKYRRSGHLDGGGGKSAKSASEAIDRLLTDTPTMLPQVAPPTQAFRSKLSGPRSAAAVSASAPPQCIFAGKATISTKPVVGDASAPASGKGK